MTLEQENALTVLQEECAEVIKVICKIKRFGMQPIDNLTGIAYDNQCLLQEESKDLHAILQHCHEVGVITPPTLSMVAQKIYKIKQYTQ